MTDIRRLPEQKSDAWQWQSRGACLDTDASVFFHPDFERGVPRARRSAAAKMVCGGCPVLEQCLQYALTVQEPYGTWGGLDELERRDVLRSRRGHRSA